MRADQPPGVVFLCTPISAGKAAPAILHVTWMVTAADLSGWLAGLDPGWSVTSRTPASSPWRATTGRLISRDPSPREKITLHRLCILLIGRLPKLIAARGKPCGSRESAPRIPCRQRDHAVARGGAAVNCAADFASARPGECGIELRFLPCVCPETPPDVPPARQFSEVRSGARSGANRESVGPGGAVRWTGRKSPVPRAIVEMSIL